MVKLQMKKKSSISSAQHVKGPTHAHLLNYAAAPGSFRANGSRKVEGSISLGCNRWRRLVNSICEGLSKMLQTFVSQRLKLILQIFQTCFKGLRDIFSLGTVTESDLESILSRSSWIPEYERCNYPLVCIRTSGHFGPTVCAVFVQTSH